MPDDDILIGTCGKPLKSVSSVGDGAVVVAVALVGMMKMSLHEIVSRAAGRAPSLAGKNFVEIAVKRRPALGAPHGVTLGLRGDDQRAERTFFATRGGRPIESILFALGTCDPLRKFAQSVAETILGGIVS